MVSHKGQRSRSCLPHDYREEHRRQNEHTKSRDNAALTQTRQTDNKYTSAENTALGLPGPPFLTLSLLRVSYRQDVHRASRLTSTMPGLGLMLVLTRTNTGVQISLLLVRKPLLPGECYSSQLKGSRTGPQMFCPESESPKLREQDVHGNTKA